jgi:hypothetical protein
MPGGAGLVMTNKAASTRIDRHRGVRSPRPH